jgi:hypothetical protein
MGEMKSKKKDQERRKAMYGEMKSKAWAVRT